MQKGTTTSSVEPPAKGARRLLWGLVIGIAVLNLLIFLATLRRDHEAPPPVSGPARER